VRQRRNKVKVLMLTTSNKGSLRFDLRTLGMIMMKMVLMIRWKGRPLLMKVLLQQAMEISRKGKTVILRRTKRTRKLQKRNQLFLLTRRVHLKGRSKRYIYALYSYMFSTLMCAINWL
jgi:hypothetical protein